MPIPRDPDLPQINADQLLFGSIPIGLMPNGTAPHQIPYWDGVDWHMATLVPQEGMDIEFDAEAGTLSFVNADYRVYGSFTAEAIKRRTETGSFTAEAVLV